MSPSWATFPLQPKMRLVLRLRKYKGTLWCLDTHLPHEVFQYVSQKACRPDYTILCTTDWCMERAGRKTSDESFHSCPSSNKCLVWLNLPELSSGEETLDVCRSGFGRWMCWVHWGLICSSSRVLCTCERRKQTWQLLWKEKKMLLGHEAATIFCGFCGMKGSHMGEKPSSNVPSGQLQGEASPGCQSGNQSSTLVLKVLKGENCLHFHVCWVCVVSNGKFHYRYKTEINWTCGLGFSKHPFHLSHIKRNLKILNTV